MAGLRVARFMAPLARETVAESFWSGVADGVARGERIFVVARVSGRVVGTVQVVLKQPENQPHRGELAKMLVHPEARRGGVATRMLRFAEGAARAAGKSLLVLDAVTGGDAGGGFMNVRGGCAWG